MSKMLGVVLAAAVGLAGAMVTGAVGATGGPVSSSPGATDEADGAASSKGASGTDVSDVEVGDPVVPVLSPRLDSLPVVSADSDDTVEIAQRVNPLAHEADQGARGTWDRTDVPTDPLIGSSRVNSHRTPSVGASWDGVGNPVACGGSAPPDPIGDVGPNHYVQMVNCTKVQIWNKTGTSLLGPVDLGTFWTAGTCTNNDGDPVVVYDALADRWVLSQFYVAATPYKVCVAVSQTADPTGAYYQYDFVTPELPDYPKLAVWPDGYYMSTNESTYSAYALDRAAMLAGNPATFQRFTGGTNFLLPSDIDGSTPPAPGEPNHFYTFKDGTFHGGGPDRIEIWDFHVDWAVPANSTFTLAATLPVAAFTYTACGSFNFDCVPQSGTAQKVDQIGEWPMWRFSYRNFGTHETLLGNFSVGGGTGTAGSAIRWFELRRTGGGAWTLYQEGTHDLGDGLDRWMGSIAMDQSGNIALGYSASSPTAFPSLRFATRAPGDPLGTLGPEVVLQAGGGSQTASNRWGDYSAMTVDPADDCTFWYTGEYYAASSPTTWSTRIGNFKEPSCGSAFLDKTVDLAQVEAGGEVRFELEVGNNASAPRTGVVLTDPVPAGTEYVAGSATCGGTEVAGVMTFDLGTLQLGDTVTCEFKVRAGPDYTTTVFEDGFESGTSAWVLSNSVGGVDWVPVTTNSNSGTTSMWAEEPAFITDALLATAAPVAVTAGTEFLFWHEHDLEWGGVVGFDGGVIEISTNGGASWSDLGADIVENGYIATISGSFGSPIMNRDAFTGDVAWRETRVDLSPYAGSDALLRFRSASDSSISRNGWWVDDVRILDRVVFRNTATLNSNEDGVWVVSQETATEVVAPTLPGAPTGVSGTPGNAAVAVSWTAPALASGQSVPTSYEVTASPGGRSCSTAGALSCTVSGLTNGTPYTFAVRASNLAGQGPAGTSGAVTPFGAFLVPVVPARVFESRPGESTVDGQQAAVGRLSAGETVEIRVAGRAGVPGDAVAVAVNVAAIAPDGPGFVTLYPCGASRPLASTLNYGAGQVIANGAIIKVGTGGRVCAYTLSAGHLILDVTGYAPAGSDLGTLVPARVFESRPGESTVDGQQAAVGRLSAGETVEIRVAGRAGVPGDADAVVVNVAAIAPDGPGFVTLYPCGASRPLASTLNYGAGQVIANGAIIKVGTGGRVCAYTLSAGHLILDVTGYVP